MHEGEKDGVSLLLWMKIKYDYEAKIDPLKQFYSGKLRSLKLRVNGSLQDYIDRLQGLAILWREIDPLIKNGFREIFLCAKVSALAFPEHLFFHSM